MANGKLNPKQELFVQAYIGEARFHAGKAAAIAGYSNASKYGSDLRKNPEIAARISAELQERALSADEVLAELRDVATADWGEFVEVVARDKAGNPVRTKMDLSAKIKSLELLGKNHKLFVDALQLSGDLTSTVNLVGIDPEDV